MARFYGGSPYGWIAREPMGVVQACLAMMPRLIAEESMRATERIGVGVGTVEPHVARQLVRGWRRDAQIRAHQVRQATMGRDLGAIGIGVRGGPDGG